MLKYALEYSDYYKHIDLKCLYSKWNIININVKCKKYKNANSNKYYDDMNERQYNSQMAIISCINSYIQT